MKNNLESGITDGGVPRFSRVMVVDDEEKIVTAFQRTLEKEFQARIKVDTFTDSKKALEHLRLHNGDYQVLIADIRMPEVTGFMLAREAKSLNSSINVVLMSAFEITAAEFSRLMPTTKVDDFIAKPVSTAKLVDVVKRKITKMKNRK